MHVTEKQPKNAHTFDLMNTTSDVATTAGKSYGFGEAQPPESVKYKATTESELAQSSGQFSNDYGEGFMRLRQNQNSQSFLVSSPYGEGRPLGLTTESELDESGGQFSVEIGEARPSRLWTCLVHSFTSRLWTCPVHSVTRMWLR